jgi:acyl-CoA thioester hydrolase
VNNVVYNEWIDTIVNKYLIEKCSLDPLKSNLVGFVVSSYCSYYSPLSYPSKIDAGLFVKKIGNSSVDSCVGIFKNSESKLACAVGGFTHVFVNKKTSRPDRIDDLMRKKSFINIKSMIKDI